MDAFVVATAWVCACCRPHIVMSRVATNSTMMVIGDIVPVRPVVIPVRKSLDRVRERCMHLMRRVALLLERLLVLRLPDVLRVLLWLCSGLLVKFTSATVTATSATATSTASISVEKLLLKCGRCWLLILGNWGRLVESLIRLVRRRLLGRGNVVRWLWFLVGGRLWHSRGGELLELCCDAV